MKDINLFRKEDSLYLVKISKKEQSKNVECDGFLLDMDEKEARRTIESLKGKNKVIAILAGDDSFNRRVIETLKCKYLVSPERNNQKDSVKQRASGLNHVLAKEAVKKGIEIVVSLSDLNSSKNDKEKIKRISRIIQNIKICRKANCKIKIANFSNSKDEILDEKQIKSLGQSWGMSSQQIKGCCEL